MVPLVVAVARRAVDRDARAHVGTHTEVDLARVVHVEVAVVAVRAAAAGVRASPKPMILPPVFVDVLSHVSSENVCGPDCQYGETPWTGAVLDVPGKFVAGSESLSSAPGTLRRVRAVQRQVVRAGPVVRRRAARLAEAPLPVGIVGEHAARVRRRRAASRPGSSRSTGAPDQAVAERVGRRGSGRSGWNPAARSCRRSRAAAGSTTWCRRSANDLITVEVAVVAPRSTSNLEACVVAVPCRGPADAHRARDRAVSRSA